MRHSKSRFIGVGIPLSQGESVYLFLEFTIFKFQISGIHGDKKGDFLILDRSCTVQFVVAQSIARQIPTTSR